MFRTVIGSVMAVAVLAACAEAPDFSEDYQRYEQAFRERHSYTVHAVDRDGYKLHAREFVVPAEGAAGPLIILMHGFPDSLHLYDRVAPMLAKDRRVVAFDFLGWGSSDKPQDHTYDVASLRRDLEAVIDHFEPQKAVLVVHDSSGQPGIDYALDNPSRVAELVLLNTYYGPSDKLVPPPAIDRFSTPGVMRDLLVLGSTLSDGRWQSGVADQLGAFFDDAEARDTYLPLFVHQALGIRPAFFGLNRVLRDEIAARRGRLDALRRLTVPTKVVFGAEDPFLNVHVAREFHAVLPRSELHLVERAAHYVQLDRPDAVAALILAAPRP